MLDLIIKGGLVVTPEGPSTGTWPSKGSRSPPWPSRASWTGKPAGTECQCNPSGQRLADQVDAPGPAPEPGMAAP